MPQSAPVSPSSPPESFLKRFLRRWLDPPVSRPGDMEERARLSFLLQQQEAELHSLRKVLIEAQQSLKKAEGERQKWTDVFNARQIDLEKQKAQAAVSGKVLKDLDEELRQLRREKVSQQRVYEDRIQGLLDQLTDLQKGYSTALARQSNFQSGAEEKGWVLEKRALEEQVRETEDKVFLAEERADKEKAEKAEIRKQADLLKKNMQALEEKVRQAENALQLERKKNLDLDKERAVLQSKLKETEANLEHLKRESKFLEPAELSEELIILRDRIQELEKSPASFPVAEEENRRAAQERASSVVREYENLRSALEKERALWAEERARLESQRAEEASLREAEKESRMRAEDRFQGLQRENETLRMSLEEERGHWSEERRRLMAQWEKEKEHRVRELSLRCSAEDRLSDALKQLEAHQEAWERERLERRDAAPPVPEPAVDIARLHQEIDALLAENAGLQDEIRFLLQGR